MATNREQEPARVVSVSIGSSRRDHKVEVEYGGRRFLLERVGTGGDLRKAADIIRDLDGRVAAIGLGGIDLYIYAGGRRYTIRDALKLKRAAVKTPVVDGSGLKHTLEREVIRRLTCDPPLIRRESRVLLVSAVDRFGMAETLVEVGADVRFGDLAFGLGLPVMLRTLRQVDLVARLLLPVLTRLPFQMLYPTGKAQEKTRPKFHKHFAWAEVIAGDFHFIRRHLPEAKGKTVITNTVTQEDLAFLKARGVRTLVATTPEHQGRSFGTNVMEALCVAMTGKAPEAMTEDDYTAWMRAVGFQFRVEQLIPLLDAGG